ncbi:Glutathione peroxidase family protein [Marinobacterium lacunae]|uniref:Glutathione peroxidase n=1 Tax=Marinobacterium lacunae TaxID=1232683 RepID=A0A081FV21_9GAMM|nr:glutathione peroxidase [Marinobacterium lacunae]KEA62376.1 Glutathione peroxidase family protein [Marinobacterium lacunae]
MIGSMESQADCPAVLDFNVRTLADQDEVRLCDAYAGQVLLVVNTASRCAFTKQYDGLEALYARYREQGFAVLGFPSNDFGGQEPGTENEIQDFCRTTYGVEFPMFGKTHVRGKDVSPFWGRLIEISGTTPKWNFYKYLIGRDGRVIDSYSSMTAPDSKRLMRDIEHALAEPPSGLRGNSE